MKQMHQKVKMHNNQGFTLIELMIVITIIGLLASVAIPAYQHYSERTKVSAAINSVLGIKTKITECYTSQGRLDICTAGAFHIPANITTSGVINHITNLSVNAGGIIHLTSTGRTEDGTALMSITMTPTPNSGQLNWVLTGTGCDDVNADGIFDNPVGINCNELSN